MEVVLQVGSSCSSSSIRLLSDDAMRWDAMRCDGDEDGDGGQGRGECLGMMLETTRLKSQTMETIRYCIT